MTIYRLRIPNINKALRGTVATILLTLLGPAVPAAPVYEKRHIDTKPIEHILKKRLPPGTAEAFYWLDTSGDQGKSVETGLIVVVRFGNKELRQTILSGREIGHGSAIAFESAIPPNSKLIDVAECEDTKAQYALLTGNGKVYVQIGQSDGKGKVIAAISLPPGIMVAIPAEGSPPGLD